jgi:SNF2 family DNA or RNA helicase
VAPVATTRKSMEPWLKDEVVFYKHQVEGVRKLMRWRSFLLADDMGLGKSLQALTVFIGDVIRNLGQTAIVICPTTLKDNWADEIEKFTRLKFMVLGSEYNPKTGGIKKLTAGERSRQIVEFACWTGPKVLITNYEQIKPHLGELNALPWRVAIFDEAHQMKNPESQRTKACLALKAERNFMLTGSPMLNRVDELWPALHKISPGIFKNFYAFKGRYCVLGGFRNKAVIGVKNKKELTQILEQVMLRRLKKDVLDLPPVQYIQVKVGLSDTQRALYKQIFEDFEMPNLDPNVEPEIIDNYMTRFMRLKQVCATPAIFGFPDDSEKLDVAVDRIMEYLDGDERVVVFTQFKSVIDMLEKRLAARGESCYKLSGDVPIEERQGVVKTWSSSRRAPILCMLQVAGVGLNMTAARSILFVDKLFVPKLNQQAVDRCHRIGASTTQNVSVVELIAKVPVEARVEKILADKSELFDNVIEVTQVMKKLLQLLEEE